MTESSPTRGVRRTPTSELPDLGDLIVLMDVEADQLDQCLLHDVLNVVKLRTDLEEGFVAEIEQVLKEQADRGPETLDHSVAVIHQQLKHSGPPIEILCRLAKPLPLRDFGGEHVRFLWVLLSNEATHPSMDAAAEFARLMEESTFREAALAAKTPHGLHHAYQRALEREVHFESHIPAELRPTGRTFGGVLDDVRRRLPYLVSDFRDGLCTKSLASIIFLYFACLAPTVAFGALAANLMDNQIGPIEMIMATGACGVVYAFFSGQPLTILGGVAPIVILQHTIYDLCIRFGVPFLPTLCWIGLWTMVLLLVLAATEACCWIRFFTRFTDDTFAALISLIFVYEALRGIFAVLGNGKLDAGVAWMSLVLSLGTYLIAINLSQFRKSPYLRHPVREFLADFGPTIAIICMTAVALLNSDIRLPALNVPLSGLATTSGRPWWVAPLEAPPWVRVAAVLPALVVTILVYLDQNITVRLVNSEQHRLKKGAGYHLDLAVVGIMIGVCSLFGLPWMVAATVRSLNHVRSLATVRTDAAGAERVVSVVETRVTALAVNVLIGLTLLLLPLVSKVPMSVLFGLFLFMGVASMSGNQFFERLRLWLMDPSRYPPTYYLRAVPSPIVHKFTAIQFVCLLALWLVKVSPIRVSFPVFIALLVPVRIGLERLFKREHLALLDTEEVPQQEEERYT